MVSGRRPRGCVGGAGGSAEELARRSEARRWRGVHRASAGSERKASREESNSGRRRPIATRAGRRRRWAPRGADLGDEVRRLPRGARRSPRAAWCWPEAPSVQRRLVAVDVHRGQDRSSPGGEVLDEVVRRPSGPEGPGRAGRRWAGHLAEHRVDLAGEVVEQGAPRDVRLGGELLHREPVEPVVVGELLGAGGDAPRGGVPPRGGRRCTLGHRVQFCTLSSQSANQPRTSRAQPPPRVVP